ncbi:NCS1 nucleoside transporter family [Xylariales sp. PMI_506]|nr:NCS1 nucleoside transporter family [Xylariales sp. PMI_506]
MSEHEGKGPQQATAYSVADSDANTFWSRLQGRFALEVEPSSIAPKGSHWSNKDLDPVPTELQSWHTYDFVTYWISDAFSVSNWRLGSVLVAIGLSWKLSLMAIALGNFIMSLVVTSNGLIGARLHIPFSVQARASFGFYFSYVMVIFRVVVSLFWYGIGMWTGGECVQAIIYAWAPNFRKMPNYLPESAGITSSFMICYFISFLIILPFHWVPVHKVRWIFAFKAFVTPIACIAVTAYLAHAAGGGSQIFYYENELSGSKLGWAFMSGLNGMIGNFATLGVNMNDFARYSKKPYSPYIQLIVMPTVFLLIGLFGIIGANASRILYGEVLWDPIAIANQWTSPGGRAAAFFVAFAFLVANIAILLSAHTVAVAVDLSTLLPKYINLRRGQYICCVLGTWAVAPWKILASVDSLLDFLDAYTIWLAPISSILIADYWIVNKQRVSIVDLYNLDGIYAYERWGTNWRAVVAFTIGWVPLVPGLAYAVVPTIKVSDGANNLYSIGYFYGFLSTAVVYIGLSWLFPPRSVATGKTIREGLDEAAHIDQYDVTSELHM